MLLFIFIFILQFSPSPLLFIFLFFPFLLLGHFLSLFPFNFLLFFFHRYIFISPPPAPLSLINSFHYFPFKKTIFDLEKDSIYTLKLLYIMSYNILPYNYTNYLTSMCFILVINNRLLVKFCLIFNSYFNTFQWFAFKFRICLIHFTAKMFSFNGYSETKWKCMKLLIGSYLFLAMTQLNFIHVV